MKEFIEKVKFSEKSVTKVTDLLSVFLRASVSKRFFWLILFSFHLRKFSAIIRRMSNQIETHTSMCVKICMEFLTTALFVMAILLLFIFYANRVNENLTTMKNEKYDLSHMFVFLMSDVGKFVWLIKSFFQTTHFLP